MKNMIININDLRRFDFTGHCKECQYLHRFNDYEYCCSFVIDYFKKDSFQRLKEEVEAYIEEGNFDLSLINPENICFFNDDEFGVQLLFQTNLKIDKWIILKELRKAILKSPYFANVNFIQGSLYHKEFNQLPIVLPDNRVKNKEEEKVGVVDG